jgi:hypothetical protein
MYYNEDAFSLAAPYDINSTGGIATFTVANTGTGNLNWNAVSITPWATITGGATWNHLNGYPAEALGRMK